ncbi:dihydrolipoamide dehydrogenase [Paucimonas lemoignei]|uniref:Dihydrolipoamide dehydrogenase n=1 Tax=Paucimonas lemoignei TaxID=29443 RepID=A0A4R3HTM2_PAULE|nr:dihydrolipoyl dehydrogenase [Paucimonas lemoignei]TCS36348.1 dihydrolipoamide dehydrogenase [Paucimonas lemoignei]
MKKTISVDIAIVGAGTAGLVAYRDAKSNGKRVLLIEGGPYGTTCARVGCMPSKLLIAAAEARHQAMLAPQFGVIPVSVSVDGKAVMARIRAERDRFVGFVLDEVNRIPSEDRIHGFARFISPQSLQVDEHTRIDAERIVIATGSSPQIPDRLSPHRLLTSDDIFDLEDLPESIAIVGAGIIGMEIGQALHRLGVRVSVFGRSDRVLQLSDPAVQTAARDYFAGEMDMRLHTEILDTISDDSGVTVRSRGKDGMERSDRYAYVLAATGRRPNLARLGLEHAGLELDEAGVPKYDPHTMQCGNAPIFIAGDVNATLPILHEATDEGRIAGDNAARFPNVQARARYVPFAVAFTDPQTASVGQSYRTLEPGRYVIGEASFENQGRSRVMLQNHGLLRLYADSQSGKLLGAEMFGPRAEHLGHLLAWACQKGMTLAELMSMPFYHPTIEEGLRTAVRDAKKKLKTGLTPMEACTDCIPGA